jgi:predicted ATPase with chaperone activity
VQRRHAKRPADVRIFCKLDASGQSLMRSATRSEQPQLNARAFHRVLKIARTIARLCVAGSDETVRPAVAERGVAPAHLAEAIQYRPRRQE